MFFDNTTSKIYFHHSLLAEDLRTDKIHSKAKEHSERPLLLTSGSIQEAENRLKGNFSNLKTARRNRLSNKMRVTEQEVKKDSD